MYNTVAESTVYSRI